MKNRAYGIIPFYQDEETRYLIGQRSGPEGYWKFPKGHKEAGETDIQTALRETHEEIGVQIDPADVITERSFQETYTYTDESGAVEKSNTYWLAPVPKEAVIELNDEFTRYRVVTFKEALKLLSDNSQEFFTEAHIYLQDGSRCDKDFST
ncbi:MAG: NUDIX domain-containing protein [Candidatus Paceibacterota bacterium]